MALLGKKFKKLNHKRLINSFKYASSGITEAYEGEQNIKIHTTIAILVVILGFVLKISYIEWLLCVLLIGVVMMAEFFNTAIEYVTDIASPNINDKARRAKDIAAGAVLWSAIISAVIGSVIFIPKIILFIGGLI